MTDQNPVQRYGICRQDQCHQPIELRDDMWVHPDPLGGWYRDCRDKGGRIVPSTVAAPELDCAKDLVGGAARLRVWDDDHTLHVLTTKDPLRGWVAYQSITGPKHALTEVPSDVTVTTYSPDRHLDPHELIQAMPPEVQQAMRRGLAQLFERRDG